MDHPKKINRTYLALLRGINVGGNNIIKMADLKAAFESLGMRGVRTYIQSGNVIFDAGESDPVVLTSLIATKLSARFEYKATLVVVPLSDVRRAVEEAPAGFGTQPDLYRYDVAFLMPTIAPSDVVDVLTPRGGVDQFSAGTRVVYFQRLIELATQSYLNKLVSLPIYKRMTIRNWNTTTTLLDMMAEAD